MKEAVLFKETEQKLYDIESYYLDVILKKAKEVGGICVLSEKLGYSSSYLTVTMRRKSFEKLREVTRKIISGDI